MGSGGARAGSRGCDFRNDVTASRQALPRQAPSRQAEPGRATGAVPRGVLERGWGGVGCLVRPGVVPSVPFAATYDMGMGLTELPGGLAPGLLAVC